MADKITSSNPGKKNLFARLPHWFKEQDYEWARKVYAAIISVQHPDAIKHYLDPVASQQTSQQKWRDELNVLYNFAHTWYQSAAGKAIYRMFNLPPHGNYFDLAWNLLVRGVELEESHSSRESVENQVRISREKIKAKKQVIIAWEKAVKDIEESSNLKKIIKNFSDEEKEIRKKPNKRLLFPFSSKTKLKYSTRKLTRLPELPTLAYRFVEPLWKVDTQDFFFAINSKFYDFSEDDKKQLEFLWKRLQKKWGWAIRLEMTTFDWKGEEMTLKLLEKITMERYFIRGKEKDRFMIVGRDGVTAENFLEKYYEKIESQRAHFLQKKTSF